jgi:catalase
MRTTGTPTLRTIAAALAVMLGTLGAAQAATTLDSTVPVPQAAVAAFNRLSGGPHPGFRANHAKGVLLTGHFTASKDAASLSKAAHLAAGQSVPVIVRFSDAGGVPNIPDTDPNTGVHGMAIRFTLPGQSFTDIVALSASVFPVATPEEFVAMLNAIADSGAAKTHPTPIETFFQGHPRAAAWATTPRPPPESFATVEFYGLNSFKFTNAAGVAQFGRYQIVPVAGVHALPEAQVKTASPNYLMDDIQKRVSQAPVKFRVLVQLAGSGDAIIDPSIAWPASRPTVELGTITIDGVSKDQVGEQKRLMFNPLAVPPGIEPSQDPVLLIRPAAYAVSFAQRVN